MLGKRKNITYQFCGFILTFCCVTKILIMLRQQPDRFAVHELSLAHVFGALLKDKLKPHLLVPYLLPGPLCCNIRMISEIPKKSTSRYIQDKLSLPIGSGLIPSGTTATLEDKVLVRTCSPTPLFSSPLSKVMLTAILLNTQAHSTAESLLQLKCPYLKNNY